MKVLFDFRKYDGVIGGVEQGVIQITKYMGSHGHKVTVLCKKNRLEDVTAIYRETENIDILPLDVDTHAMSSKNRHLDSTTIQDIAVERNVDIIHFFYNWGFPKNNKRPSVLTVHDVIPFTFREAMGLYRNLVLYKPGIRKACTLNDMIATVSEFSKHDIAEKVHVNEDKIRVIPNGLRIPNPEESSLEDELRRRYDLDRFIINVGGIHERKNIIRLVQAFAILVKQGFKCKLLITGNVSGHAYQMKMKQTIDSVIEELRLGERIVFTGFVSERELDSLFRIAEILIYPSLYEGFGIPILEAMKMGLPVITSNTTAMPEVAGEAALLVDPLNIDDMAEAMLRLMNNTELQDNLRKKGLQRAAAYTWERTSEMYLDLYEEIISSQGRSKK
jgi:glycosyltransferase involved in cell wall biosynthesis